MGLKLQDYFVFGGVSSADFGFYASGENAYNAPEKEYEMVQIPGRNGDYAIDNNRYSNVTVKYPCYYEKVGGDLPKDIRAFRNALLSKSGYCRLYDTHNPDEFRLAVCRNVIEIDPTEYDLLGAVEIEFDCKPQRYLVSGETPIEVTSGSKLVNPTYFDARPLIVVEADDDGIVYVNDKTISYNPESIGKLELDNTRTTQRVTETTGELWAETTTTWTTSRYNSGDAIGTDGEITFRVTVTFPGYTGYRGDTGTNIAIRNVTEDRTNQRVTFSLAIPKNVLKFNAGTNKAISAWFTSILQYEADQSSGVLETTLLFNVGISHSASPDKTIAMVAYGDVPTGATSMVYQLDNIPVFYVDSSRAAFEGEVYFDTEACESYIYGDDGEIIAINNVINTGPDYPKLVPGENGISFFGGINSCKFIPRWWTI